MQALVVTIRHFDEVALVLRGFGGVAMAMVFHRASITLAHGDVVCGDCIGFFTHNVQRLFNRIPIFDESIPVTRHNVHTALLLNLITHPLLIFAKSVVTYLDFDSYLNRKRAALVFDALAGHDVGDSLARVRLAELPGFHIEDSGVVNAIGIVPGQPDEGQDGLGEVVGFAHFELNRRYIFYRHGGILLALLLKCYCLQFFYGH